MGKGKPRKAVLVTMGGQFEPDLATKFGNLAHGNGVSIREALRRVMVNAILEGRIPGINSLELESREHEKWGNATPVYDGEPRPSKKSTTGSVEPVRRVESA